MQTIALRPETTKDEAFLRQLYASTRAEEMAPVPWPEAQKAAFLNMQFDLQHAHYRRHYPDAEFLLIQREETPVGRYYLHRGGAAFLLIDIALLPDFRGQGIGGGLLRKLLAEAGAAGKPVRLHVEPASRAERLYLRLGFSAVEDQGMHRLMEWTPARLPPELASPT